MAHVRNGIYSHYKGNLYKVIAEGRHSETEEELVIYQALYGERGIWVRPKGMFTENVIINGNSVPRFAYIADEEPVGDVT